MKTESGLWVPDPEPQKPAPPATLFGYPVVVISGNRGMKSAVDDGYYGHLIISKGEHRVELRITHAEYETLCKMGIAEYT